jgi:hypothetical protein
MNSFEFDDLRLINSTRLITLPKEEILLFASLHLVRTYTYRYTYHATKERRRAGGLLLIHEMNHEMNYTIR